MGAKYQVYKDVAGKFRFRLKAGNNKIVAVSQGYENHAGCLNGVKSVQNNCNSEIEDMTIEGARFPNPKYQVFYDKSCGYRFHLNATNGEIIAASEGYEAKEGCMNGIKAVQASCNAEIEDLTVTKPTVSNAPMMENAESTMAVEPEMVEAPVCEDKELKLELFDIPTTVAKGEVVLFKGEITENCQGKGKILVSIREHDRSFFFDEVLARGYAEEDGSFSIGWKAKTFDFWDNKGEVYAQYDRDQKPKHVRSEFKTIVVK
jgi:uncharacterized protein YegP (UPF0339 family)